MKKNGHRSERGSAILVTLGILALVMVMAMAFAFTSRTNLQIARVNSSSIKSKLISNSAIAKVLADLRAAGANNASILYHSSIANYFSEIESDTLYSAKSGGTSESVDGDYYRNNNLFPYVLNSRSDYLKEAYLPDGTPATNFKFTTLLDSDSDIIGRYAFVVVNDTPKVDINAVVMRNATNYLPIVDKDAEDKNRASLNVSSFDWDNDYYYPLWNAIPNDSGTWSGESGKRGSFNKNGYFTWELGSLIAGAYYDDADEITSSTKKAPYLSYSHITFSDTDDNVKYTYYSGDTPESYYNADNEYARFDITGYEWKHGTESYYDAENNPQSKGSWESTSTVYADRLQYARGLVNCLTHTGDRTAFWTSGNGVKDMFTANKESDAPMAVDASSEDNSGNSTLGIPFLQGDDVKNWQVAANMVDFCDSDNKATYGKIGTTDASIMEFDKLETKDAMPDYFGNELAPAFSEVQVTLSPTCKKITSDEYKYNCDMTMTLEFCNPYITAISEDNWNITVVVKGYYQFDSETPVAFTLSDTKNSSISELDSGKFYVGNETKIEKTGFMEDYEKDATTTTGGIDKKPAVVIEKVTITKVLMYLGNKDEGYSDLAIWTTAENDKSFSAGTTLAEGATSGAMIMDTSTIDTSEIEIPAWISNADTAPGTDGEQFYSSIEAVDPAYNYSKASIGSSDLWKWKEDGEGQHFSESELGTNGNVNSCIYYTDADDTQWDKKKAAEDSYCDVRNVPFDNFADVGLVHRGAVGQTLNLLKYNSDSDTFSPDGYANGDARILDEIKVGPAKFRQGLLSSMQANTDNTKIKDLFESELELYGTVPSSGDLKHEATDDIINKYSRAAVPLYCLENKTDARTSDEEWEGTVANAISLMSSRYEMFSVFVVGQSLKQIGRSNASDGIKTDTQFNLIRPTLASPVVYTDGTTRYFCDILGSDARMISVLYDTWEKSFYIVHSEKLK